MIEFNADHGHAMTLVVIDIDEPIWHVKFKGPAGTLYEGEPYTLEVKFPERYPINPSQVKFVGTPPINEHVYSTCQICMNNLYDTWSPALTVGKLCLSIISLISEATEKTSPPDDEFFGQQFKNGYNMI